MYENLSFLKTIGKQLKVLDYLEGNNDIIDGVWECNVIQLDYKGNLEFFLVIRPSTLFGIL